MGSSSNARFKFVSHYNIDPQGKKGLASFVSELVPEFEVASPFPGLMSRHTGCRKRSSVWRKYSSLAKMSK